MTSSLKDHHVQQRSKNARSSSSSVEPHKVAPKVKENQIQLGDWGQWQAIGLKAKEIKKTFKHDIPM